MTTHLFPLAIVKGTIEHGDGTHHFGSTGSYSHWEREAQRLGLLDEKAQVTSLGAVVYERWLKDLPPGRASAWVSRSDDRLLEQASEYVENHR